MTSESNINVMKKPNMSNTCNTNNIIIICGLNSFSSGNYIIYALLMNSLYGNAGSLKLCRLVFALASRAPQLITVQNRVVQSHSRHQHHNSTL